MGIFHYFLFDFQDQLVIDRGLLICSLLLVFRRRQVEVGSELCSLDVARIDSIGNRAVWFTLVHDAQNIALSFCLILFRVLSLQPYHFLAVNSWQLWLVAAYQLCFFFLLITKYLNYCRWILFGLWLMHRLRYLFAELALIFAAISWSRVVSYL